MAKQVVVTRIFNASVELVWSLWVDPELVKRWWGPKHFTSPVARIDFREGGRSIVSMRAPKEMGSQEFYSIWDYVKIDPLKTIELIQNLADKEGNRTEPTALGMPPDFPMDIRVVVTFKEVSAGKTEMTVVQYADYGTMSEFAQMGLEQSMDKMVAVFG